MEYNVYCDESRHLEHDNAKSMLMGAISCPASEKARIYNDIRTIKTNHGLSTWNEIKWTAVSPSKQSFYLELIKYFAREPSLSFRAVVIKDKENLNHKKYNSGSHDLWYYKTYYYLLDPIVSYDNTYKIFIDIKDTQGGPKIKKLHDVLCNNCYDFKHEVIKDINLVKSHESEILELTDLIMGAIGYYHNEYYNSVSSSSAKNAVIDELFKHYETAIRYGTPRGATKMDIFIWTLGR